MKRFLREHTGGRGGFSLIEVVIALGIVAVGIFAIVGLLPLGLDTAQDSAGRTAGLAWLEEVAADIRSFPKNTAAGDPSPRFGIPYPEPGKSVRWTGYFSEGGKVSEAADARFALDLTLSRPGDGEPGAIHAQGRARWPATTDPGIEHGSVHLTTAFAH